MTTLVPVAIELRLEQLHRECDVSSFSFETTAELPPLEGLISQERAMQALRMGIKSNDKSFHIRLIQDNGESKTSAILSEISDIANEVRIDEPLLDIILVRNVNDEERPHILTMPSGQGGEFRQAMRSFGEHIANKFPYLWDNDRLDLLRQVREKVARETLGTIEEEFAPQFDNFGLMMTHSWVFNDEQGGRLINVVQINDEDKSIPDVSEGQDALQLIRDWADKNLDEEYRPALDELLDAFAQAINERSSAIDQELAVVLQKTGEDFLKQAITTFFMEFAGSNLFPTAASFIDELRTFFLEHYILFRPSSDSDGPAEGTQQTQDVSKYFAVNVLVDNSANKDTVPVIFESDPTYKNLFGHMGRKMAGQMPGGGFAIAAADHTTVEVGSLVRASGGVLVINLLDVFRKPGSDLTWNTLVTDLRSKEAKIEDPTSGFMDIVSDRLKFGAIPITTRVVIIVPRELDMRLSAEKDGFSGYDLFRIRAEFALDTERTPENEFKLAQAIGNWARKESMKPFEPAAVARLIEFSSRNADKQDRLSLNFTDLKDMAMQAHYWMQERDPGFNAHVSSDDVEHALEQHVWRSSLISEHIHELIRDGMLKIGVTGSYEGGINALSVISLGGVTFGRPALISATVSFGNGQVISVEREVKMAGPIQQKGVKIIEGYLKKRFGQTRPLAVNIQIVFEQLYGSIEGDSASVAELYAVLSSLGRVGFKQGIAVTGSCNQRGDVQAVGGINEKIEGFFDVCRIMGGLTGEQGVIIPASNANDLMLRHDVLDAVQQDRFHVWTISHVDDGIPLITDMSARDFNTLVGKRLQEFAQNAVRWQKESK